MTKRGPNPTPYKIKFYSKVNTPNDNGCMEWTGAKNSNGYGHFNNRFRKTIKAHRYSYQLHFGLIAESMNVLHKCDNPLCVSPEHLFLGTLKENTRDCIQKGRFIPWKSDKRGETNGFNKLNETQVMSIRKRISNGDKVQKIASELNLSYKTIYNIKNHKSWSHL